MIASAEPSPKLLRVCSIAVCGIASFLASFWVLFIAFLLLAALLGPDPIMWSPAPAIALLGAAAVGAAIVATIAVRLLARLLRPRRAFAHCVAIFVGVVVTLLALPRPFVYATL